MINDKKVSMKLDKIIAQIETENLIPTIPKEQQP